MRGEQAAWQMQPGDLVGSPPLARGTVIALMPCAIRTRITPACAGNRILRENRKRGGKDHPRLRGEQPVKSLFGAQGGGSPPLARGTVYPYGFSPTQHGITPACAGNSLSLWFFAHTTWDHPRLRGEQICGGATPSGTRGSPPLARGTGTMGGRITAARRITPACAGNSFFVAEGRRQF